MFSAPEEYRLSIAMLDRDGEWSPLPSMDLAQHMGRDARRVIAGAERWRFGETQVMLLSDGLEDLSVLACRVRPETQRAWVRLERRSVDGASLDGAVFERDCLRD